MNLDPLGMMRGSEKGMDQGVREKQGAEVGDGEKRRWTDLSTGVEKFAANWRTGN